MVVLASCHLIGKEERRKKEKIGKEGIFIYFLRKTAVCKLQLSINKMLFSIFFM